MTIISDSIKEVNHFPVLPVTNINVSGNGLNKVGEIYWIPVNEAVTITANVELPDAQLMVMFEEIINGNKVVADIRRPASIENNTVTIEVKFKKSANYIFSAERINLGFQNINYPVRVAFNKLEFDVYDTI